MSHEALFKSPEVAVEQINATEQGDETTLAHKARRAIRATQWLGAHYGYGLRGISDTLRQQFVGQVDIVLAELREYEHHYPEFVSEENEPEPLNTEEELAIDYRYLQHFLHVAGLKH
jgi:hypothetical protein